MERNYSHIYGQPQQKGKKITALAVAIALAATGGCAATKYLGKDKAPVEEVPTTELTTTIEDPIAKLMVLTEDFDINDDKAVTKRAEAIYKLDEKQFESLKITSLEIKNMIYIANEKLDGFKYPKNLKTDKEKYEYAQFIANVSNNMYLATTEEFVTLGDILVEKTHNKNVEFPDITVEVKPVASAYMFIAEMNDAKKTAMKLAELNYKLKLGLVENNLATVIEVANEYYKLYNGAKKIEMSNGNEFVLFSNFAGTNRLHQRYLDEKKSEELDNATGFMATSVNQIFTELTKNLDISEIIKDGNFSNTTPLKEQYKPANKVEAEQRPEAWSPEEESTTKIVEQGGKPITTQKVTEPASNNKVPATTRTETTTFIAPVTEYTTEVFVPGGEIISEWYNDDQAIDAEELAKQFEDDEQLKGDPTYTK